MNREDTEIGRELLGYKKDDVDLLLASLSHDLRVAREELHEKTNDNNSLRLRLEELEGISEQLRSALKNSEKTSELTIRQAKADAETILANAYRAASEIISEAEINKKHVSNALNQLNETEIKLTGAFGEILNTYLAMIEAVSSERTDNNTSLSQTDLAILKAHIEPISDADGVLAVWLCDNQGHIIANITKPEILSEDFEHLLIGFSKWTEHISSIDKAPELSQAFIQLKNMALIIQPIDCIASIGVIISEATNLGAIVSLISDKRERLSGVFATIEHQQRASQHAKRSNSGSHDNPEHRIE